MWYVIQTTTGKEEELVTVIKKWLPAELYHACFFLKRQLLKRLGGQWLEVTETLFPAYVFLVTDCPAAVFYELKKLPEFARILGDGRLQEDGNGMFIPLYEEETLFLKRLCGIETDAEKDGWEELQSKAEERPEKEVGKHFGKEVGKQSEREPGKHQERENGKQPESGREPVGKRTGRKPDFYTAGLTTVRLDGQGMIVGLEGPLFYFKDRIRKVNLRKRYAVIGISLRGEEQTAMLGIRIERGEGNVMKVPFSPPDITEQEIEQVVEVLHSGWITTGPKTKEFEEKIAACAHTERAVCLNSATACLELALHFLGVGPGDEVITSAYTYSASASVVCHVGARLVLVDTSPGSYEMDYEKLEQAITEKTKVIIPVDLAGVPCDYEKIYGIVERKRALFHPRGEIQEAFGRVIILADAAHAFGASRGGKRCGELADFTGFSFHAVKNLTTAEGGALVWKNIPGFENDWIYRQFMLLSLHGQNKDALAKTKLGAWEYDIVMPAFKCNMTDIMAGIGLAQLARYPQMLERRREILAQYQAALAALPVEFLIHDGTAESGQEYHSSRHLCLVRLSGKTMDFRNRLIEAMAEQGVATNVHYKPLPMHTAYRKMGFSIEDFPCALRQFENEITLPLHTCLTEEQVRYVTETFIRCYRELEKKGEGADALSLG